MAAAVQTEIRASTIGELHEHAGEAIKAHHAEIGHGNLAIDWERIRHLERQGCIIAFAAWRRDTIVGYCVAVIGQETSVDELFCAGHAWFVMQAYRKGDDLWRRLMRATEGAADSKGCARVWWQSPNDASPLEVLLPTLGYRTGGRLFIKELV